MAEKKRYELTAARIEWTAGHTIIAVLVPWDHFCHKLGVTAYTNPIARTDAIPVAVSRAPDGEWHWQTQVERVWEKIIAETPIEKLPWHAMQVETDYDWREYLK